MNRKKILVVDNSKLIIKLMTTFLEREGHEVVSAEDAFSALDILKKFTPQLIYVDLVMPKIEGDSLCKIFRTLPQLADCYIVIISAAAMEQQIDFIQIGADACIAKGPFTQMCYHILETIVESDAPRHAVISRKIRGLENLHARQITKELLSANKHLQIILEGMSQGVIEIIGKRVIYANPAALFLLQVSQEKLLGSYLDEILGPTIWERLATEICAGDVSTEGEKTLIQIHDRHIIPQCLKIKEDSMSRIILLTDITERKRMEAIIEATNLNENLGYIFSGIRHEIGNPVNSIKMALTVLNKNIETYDKATVAEFVDRSLQEVIRIEYLLKALKNFSLFESPDLRRIRLDHFIENFIPLVQDDLKNRSIELRTIIGQGVQWVTTDNRALHHILLNLLTNAADAVEGKESPRIIISISRSPPWVKIKVDDNGSGISESDKKNLFKPFFTSKVNGSGLGLVIVKKMLLKMNGSIAIESDANFGTTVTLTLPEGA
jgi:two-component system, cell cycle sensor histidine kinase and response regulator CckA